MNDQCPLSDELIDRIQEAAYRELVKGGYSGGMGGETWDLASGRAVATAAVEAERKKAIPEDRAALAKEIKDSVWEIANGECYPDLFAAIDALAASPPPSVPAGWQLVPKELLRQLKHYTICHLMNFPSCGAPTEDEIDAALAAAQQGEKP